MKQQNRISLPSVDEVLKQKKTVTLIETYGRSAVVKGIRGVLQNMRNLLLKDSKPNLRSLDAVIPEVVRELFSHLQNKYRPSLGKAINATGVILHTGLGRAVLSSEAVAAVKDCSEGYCTLASGRSDGRRAHRDRHLNDLLCELTGAEAATVVNNNAAATVLSLNSLARGREVIVSRGQLVEIGGAFRMPDVMETSGAVMREIGTTNKTHLRDYLAAINENTGAIMRVHHSNYRIVGFFSEPGIEELVELGRKCNVPVLDDLGSGALKDLAAYGLESEPLVKDSIQAGVDLACFSGDKLIGGPQSGVIVGKKEYIEKIRKNPLARAFRIGKMTIAAMEATLKLFLDEESLEKKHPSYRMFAVSESELAARAGNIVQQLKKLGSKALIKAINGNSQIGSGSVPTETLPTQLLQVSPHNCSADELADKLRALDCPIYTRVSKDAILFDFRTLHPTEDKLIYAALQKLLK